MSKGDDNYKECTACNGIAWWCRGCSGIEKLKGLKDAGFTINEAQGIYDAQFGCCNEPVVPCYVCNKLGIHKFPKKWADLKDKYFWM
jgi:hypothetical protein